jgi:mercuric reductase
MQKLDLVVIGGGAGGFGAAIKANDLGARTALVNTGLPLGGTCVNVGCVPSKALLWAAEVLHTSRHHGIPGLELEVTHLDVAAIINDELALVDRMRRDKYAAVLHELQRVTLVEGSAWFSSANTIEVNGDTFVSDRFVIATGSTATVPAIPGLREAGFITHIEALQRDRLPRSVVVIGAGPLGLELGQLFSRFGIRVTILQRSPSIFPRTEPALAHRLTEILEREGVRVITGVHVTGVTRSEISKRVTYEADGVTETVEAEEILLAAGKTASTARLQLEAAGVNLDSRESIRVSGFLQTSAAHIYAAGDVTDAPARVEMTAGHEGTLAAENALTGTQHAIEYDTVPYAVFTDPQLAGVGLTEDQQMERLGVCACRTISLEHVPKALIVKRSEGLIKMTVHPETEQIMGVHILAPHAGELVAQAIALLRNRNTISDVLEFLPMFPTLSEGVKLAAMAFRTDISKLSCCV